MIEKIKHYLREHKGASLFEVVEETGAEEALVLRLIREGRIIVSDPPAIQCERCGKSISEGRFCNTCTSELTRGLMGDPKPSATPAANAQGRARFHLDPRKKRDDTND